MSSERKIAANQHNSQKSSGPRTAAGKLKASRNAMRHGLAAIVHRQPTPFGEIERFAKASCGNDSTSALFEQACVIAAVELELRSIREQKIAMVERLREPTAIALAKGDNSLELAVGRRMQAWVAVQEINALLPKTLEKFKDQLPPPLKFRVAMPDWVIEDDIVPIRLKALLWQCESPEVEQRALALAKKQIEDQERDEFAALEAAAADLIRLDRYERRAWARQRRAIRHFMSTKLMGELRKRGETGPC